MSSPLYRITARRPSPERYDLSGPTIIRLLEKSVLNLTVHAMQPLLSPLASLAISFRLGLQFLYPIFCRAKLVREFLRHVERLSTVGLSGTGCSMQQLHNALPRSVELIRAI
jgi:hypothetical protein